MNETEMIAVGALITITASAVALVIKQLESSRCSKIKCCGVQCDREVPDEPQTSETSTKHP